MANIKNERGNTAKDNTDQEDNREYFNHLYSYKFDNLD